MIIKKPIDNLRKKDFFSKLKNKCPDDEEIQRTKEVIEIIDFKSGEELTKLYPKKDVILLADVFVKFIKISIEENGINPLYFVSLPGYTWQCGMKYTDSKLRTLQDKDLNVTFKQRFHLFFVTPAGITPKENRICKTDFISLKLNQV